MMVGLSASGKSTIAKKLAEEENAIIVSSDSIREELSFYEDQSRNNEVFKIFHQRIKDGLHNGINIIADATNITIKSRKPIIKIGKDENAYICVYYVDKDICDCFFDNKTRKHPVPNDVLIKQKEKFQLPTCDEGFDEIIIQHVKE